MGANPDTKDMVDTDTLMDTTTAKRLPKPPPTTSPLSPPSMTPSPLPTPPLSRPALISLRNVPSKFPPLLTPRSLLPNALLDSVPPLAKRLSSPSPNKSVSNLSTDTPMSPHQHPLTQLPLPPMLKQSTLKIALPPNDPVILCRSIAQLKECFQDRNYLSIFILLFMPSKISLPTG